MRWSTLVFSVTLFCSLSFVNAIPHDIDEKRHWLHKRQKGPGSSSTSPAVVSPSNVVSGDSSPAVVSSTPSPVSLSSRSSSSSSSTSRSTSSTISQPPGSSSSTSSGSSSSSSSSSSSGSTSSTSSSSFSTSTKRPDTNQSYTSYRRFSSTRGLPSDTGSTEGGVETGTRSGNSFLKNKAAMGTTFAIVGLVGAALIAGSIFYLTKKARQRKRQDELDTYFEKLPANRNPRTTRINTSNPNVGGGGNDLGLGPSATDLTAPANNQTYMPRDVHYGATDQYPEQYPSYGGLEYPPDQGSVVDRPVSYAPGTAYAAAMSQRGQYNYEGQTEDPNTVPNHPFADPEHRLY